MPEKEKEFKFDYGIIVYKYRFSISRPLSDYKEIELTKCIRMGLEFKYKTMAKDDLVPEIQIIYKDENNQPQCLCADLREFHFEIKHKGDMMMTL